MENQSTMPNIIIPSELATFPLELEEIGAIVILMGLPRLDSNAQNKWKDDARFLQVVNNLVAAKLVLPSVSEDGDLNIEIDLR